MRQREQSPNHLGVMGCEANISSVSAEPWRRDGGSQEGTHLLSVWCWREEAGRRGSPVMAKCYIVAIPHSLHHLQLLLPISPPPTPIPTPTHPHPPKLPKRPVSTISTMTQMKWIIVSLCGISWDKRVRPEGRRERRESVCGGGKEMLRQRAGLN